ncbi:MAG: nickel pincer cofactor biosynthesis protein LarC [Synergistaceae bacterium]|nr:nickel pincer cofactor biosynthesis protein LarC [Synergistaceae bacterium]
MKTLYLDCFAGIAGDMFIGALLNLVPSHKVLTEGISKITALEPSEYELVIEKANKNGIAGINFDVKLNHEHEHHHEHHEHEEHEHEHGHHHHRHLADIESMIYSSSLNERIKRESIRAFSLLAQAEAHVHGTTADKIHFHEVGAVDSIIDIVGAFILMDALNWPRVLCSSINTGSGVVNCAHGILPVPAPAAEYLLHGLPVFASGSPMERTTPTGALLVKILADGFCTLPPGKIMASGYGLGNHESPDMPNVLRALLIDSDVKDSPEGLIQEKLALLECNIDDMNPQDYELVNEKLFASGALDSWLENIHMKKGRPGVKLCCLCEPGKTSQLALIIMQNTTSQGVRIHELDRLRLKWELEEINTSLGKVRVKVTRLDNNDEVIRRVPEYEDVKSLALSLGRSMWEVRKVIMSEI